MSIFNPLNPGPTQPAPYQQPNTTKPVVNPPVASYPVGNDMLSVDAAIPVYTQPGTTYQPVTNLAGPMGTSKNR